MSSLLVILNKMGTSLLKDFGLIFLILISCSLHAQNRAFPESIITGNPASSDIHLYTRHHKADILIDEKGL